MRKALAKRFGMVMLLSVMVLNVSLVLIPDNAGAAPPIKPSGPTLSTPTQNWDTNLPSTSRFTVLADFGGAAVRDNNTGLVWEQAPSPLVGGWPAARLICTNKTVSNTTGWRLPSVAELKSVQDPSLPAPFIPNVFSGIQSSSYWSASTDASTPTSAWAVEFANGTAFYATKVGPDYFTWCVRGPMNVGQY